MAHLSISQLKSLKAKLLDRQRVLTEEIKAKRERTAAEGNEDAMGVVGDAGDESVMREITDLSLQEAGRDMEELQEIDAALRRMDDGDYGDCEECGGEIDFRRLEVQPTASRCVPCQSQHEKTYAHKNMPTM
ncbi:MAG TPA: TraR/DksA family transcriptional regulator [Burkholderiales bacterium]|nr:TraR/DksA family transcriptional regulator [Burkholderiales bacterium]